MWIRNCNPLDGLWKKKWKIQEKRCQVVFFGGIRFDNCFYFPFWQVYSICFFFDFWKTLEQKFGMGKEF